MMVEQKVLGFDLLWLSNIQSAFKTEGGLAHLRGLMGICTTLGFEVIIDTGFTPNWYGHRELERELKHCRETIDAVVKHFGKHPAFFGWYIPHEIYMTWGDFRAYIDQLYPALVKRCKSVSDKPVTLSPFFILDRDQIFGNFRYNEPDQYADYWEGVIKRSGIDIIMLQDSGEHLSYVTNAQRRPFFEAMHQACTASGAKLWGNVEVAELLCKSPEKYVELYGKIHHSQVKAPPWRAVPIPRLIEKLTLAAEYSERIVCWGYQHFCRPGLGDGAVKWGKDYREYVDRF